MFALDEDPRAGGRTGTGKTGKLKGCRSVDQSLAAMQLDMGRTRTGEQMRSEVEENVQVWRSEEEETDVGRALAWERR